MNVDELVINLREQREALQTSIAQHRLERQNINKRVTEQSHELARVERLLRAAEGRKRGSQ